MLREMRILGLKENSQVIFFNLPHIHHVCPYTEVPSEGRQTDNAGKQDGRREGGKGPGAGHTVSTWKYSALECQADWEKPTEKGGEGAGYPPSDSSGFVSTG